VRKEHPVSKLANIVTIFWLQCTDIILIVAVDAVEENTFLEQPSELGSDLLASSTDVVLIIVADAGERRTSH